MTNLARAFAAMALALSLAVAALPARAQGGPPLVTDDPETPGDGHWEINLATIGAHTRGRWDVALPDADINYGWGDHIQLKLDVPWTFVHEEGQGWKNGLGAVNAGVKWRFIDKEQAGFSMSTYPQITRAWLHSSIDRGIVEPGTQYFLPVELATDVGDYGLDFEVGRNFITHAKDEWELGAIVSHECIGSVECLAEIHERASTESHQTLLNVGFRWKLQDKLSLLAAVGREFGPHSDDQQRPLIYLGVQILR